jgi:toxin ParE1/3/4
MKKVRFHPDAEAEMLAAAAHYETQQEGLGGRFLAATQDAANRIGINPSLYRPVQGDVRRCLAKVFPYGILFRDLPDGIIIIAVMHLHRDPDYWKARVAPSV